MQLANLILMAYRNNRQYTERLVTGTDKLNPADFFSDQLWVNTGILLSRTTPAITTDAPASGCTAGCGIPSQRSSHCSDPGPV